MHEGEVFRDIGHDLFMLFLCAPHLAVLGCVILVSLRFCFLEAVCPLAEVWLLLLSAALLSFVQLVMFFPSRAVLSPRGLILCL